MFDSDDPTAHFTLVAAGTRIISVFCDSCGSNQAIYVSRDPGNPLAQSAGYVPLECRSCGNAELALSRDDVKDLRMGFTDHIIAGEEFGEGELLDELDQRCLEWKHKP